MSTPSLRLNLARIVLFVLFAWLICDTAVAATYYIRPDGGDPTQCTGKVNAAWPATGTNQACAWSHPYYALPANGQPRIKGGDTLIIGAGEYMIGFGAPGASDVSGRCYSGGPYDCYLPPVPSGATPQTRTRILGEGYDTGCATPPKLWGSQRVSFIVNLQGSSNVEMGCLEITDKSDCIEFHYDPDVRCARDSAPYGDWAGIGISAKASRNVWLHDINIHGLANRGISAGGLTNWALDRVKINANGWGGWDGDVGSGSSNSGVIAMRRVEIAWNGCGERWQTGEIHACWGQQNGGYGDGLGTATTGGQWVIVDSFVHHNTSDGVDLLYMDGAEGTSVTIRRMYAAGNAGNQIKTKGQGTIENSVVIGNCSYFYGQFGMTEDDNCRALGNAISIGLINGQTTTIRHNTITGEGDCLVLTGGGNSATKLFIQNNAFVGQLDWRSNLHGATGSLTCGQYQDGGNPVTTYTKNLIWNVKSGQCPAGSLCVEPMLENSTLTAFDPDPADGSPLIDAAPSLAGITSDFYLYQRPSGAANDVGAVEKGSSNAGDSTPPVVGSVNAVVDSGTITLSATASDNVDVASVSFVVDGEVVATSELEPYTVIINTSLIGYGPHTMLARATDAAGNVGSSPSVPFETEKDKYKEPEQKALRRVAH